AGLLDLRREARVRRGLRVPRREAGDWDPELRQRVLVVRGDAQAIGLLVVEDVDLLQAELLRVQRIRRALEVVRSDDTDVVALAARVVLVRLTGRGPRAGMRQTDVRVGRADHPDRPVGRAVEHRDLDLGATRVERTDDADDALVLRVRLRVRRALLGRPRTFLRRRVIARLVADLVLAGLEVVLLEDELDRFRHLHRLCTA